MNGDLGSVADEDSVTAGVSQLLEQVVELGGIDDVQRIADQ